MARVNGGSLEFYYRLPLLNLSNIVKVTVDVQKEEEKAQKKAIAKAKKFKK